MNLLRRSGMSRWIGLATKRLVRAVMPTEDLRVFGATDTRDTSLISAVYVLNLDRQPLRWTHLTKELRRLGVGDGRNLLELCHRVSAVDGKTFELAEASGVVGTTYPLEAQYYADPDPKLLTALRDRPVQLSMTREEIAVALSHVHAWRRIVDEHREYALILEDDVFFEPSFARQLNRSWRELPTGPDNCRVFDFLTLSYREVDRGAERARFSQNLFRPFRGYWWLSGYLLTREGAEKLLAMLPVVGPVDLWMNHRFRDLDAYMTPTSVISQRTDFPSDNRYSILPLLSQVGVQSDKTHLLLEHSKGQKPVFCLGFDQHSATVMESALSLLGYRCFNDQGGEHSASVESLIRENQPLLFDAYLRLKCISQQASHLLKLYPHALFVAPRLPQVGSELSTEEHATAMALISSEKNRLLLCEGSHPKNWTNLCAFLDCDAPQNPFPLHVVTVDARKPRGSADVAVSVAERTTTVHEHDVHPWIIPYRRLREFGILSTPRTVGRRIGRFDSEHVDDLTSLDEARWTALTTSFPSNRAMFRRDKLAFHAVTGCRMTLDSGKDGTRALAAGSFRSSKSHHYGRFEALIRPAKAPGVVTAFFLHRNDPWQEIDIELLGQDTTKMLVNVYFNPGVPGSVCNYGNRGTPFVVDLGFDAAANLHEYAIEWEPHEVRWFVDGQLVHVRAAWEPTPLPQLPMHLYFSIWPPTSVDLAGDLRPTDLPVFSDVRRVSRWKLTQEASRYGQ